MATDIAHKIYLSELLLIFTITHLQLNDWIFINGVTVYEDEHGEKYILWVQFEFAVNKLPECLRDAIKEKFA